MILVMGSEKRKGKGEKRKINTIRKISSCLYEAFL